MTSLKDQVVLITGGGSGMGLASAKLFLEQGARVAIAGRNQAKLAEAAKSLGGGDKLMTHVVDVSVPEQAKALVDAVIKKWSRVDILVNNAGLNLKKRAFRELTPESWKQVIGANLDGAFYCIHYVIGPMLERKNGLIINISSTAGLRATPLGGIAYAASKFGMSALGLGLHAEEKDIRVTNIHPGEVDTPILDNRPTPLSKEHRDSILKAEDIARAVLFVAQQPVHVSIPELVIKPVAQMFI